MLPSELKQENTENNWIRDRKIALENTKRSHDYNKKLYDKNRKDFEFNIKDMVFVETN